MILQQACFLCPCRLDSLSSSFSNRKLVKFSVRVRRRRRRVAAACALSSSPTQSELHSSVVGRTAKDFLTKRLSGELSEEVESASSGLSSSKFSSFEEDPIVDKLRTQLGVIHPIPSPPINRNIAGLFVFFFFVGVVFDKLWTSRKKSKPGRGVVPGMLPQLPTSFSLLLEKDLQRKESVEWVNMVLGKLWKVYRGGIENWLIGLLQPVIDNLKKPDYVQRVEIKQFSLGEEPLSVRNVERRTSRRVNDLQYQIGLRYTGGARMLLMLSLKFGIIPISVPVGVRDFDIDGELWVKLRLIPSEPWVGAASWAFVSLPKITFELSPFRLFNVMAIPVLSMFLTKLLTEDLPRLFVRPKKIVLDFQKGKAVGPVSYDFKSGEIHGGNKDFVGELSVTLVDARKLAYFFYGKTDPYVVFSLGDQKIRSKKNSQTTIFGPPGEPIWNQDFDMLVTNPKKQRLRIMVKDSLGFTDFTIGMGEVELGSLQDTVPTDRVVALQGGWGLFNNGSCGEILLRLTYKAYVEDEEDERIETNFMDTDVSDDEMSDSDDEISDSGGAVGTYEQSQMETNGTEQESFINVLAALLVSEEFQGIVSSEAGSAKPSEEASVTTASVTESDEQMASNPTNGVVPLQSESDPQKPGGSALLWLAVVTGVAVLIAMNVGDSNLFNP